MTPKKLSTTSSTATPPGCGDVKPLFSPNLFQIDTTDTQAALYFTPVFGPVSYYFIAYGYSPSDERFGAVLTQGPSSGVLSYTINFLSPNTAYYFKIRSGNGCMPGDWSNILKAKTAGSDRPGIVRFYQNSPTSISLVPPFTPLNRLNPCVYLVQPGDSLWKISRMTYGTGQKYPQIMQANQLSSFLIYPGQKLNLSCQ